MAISFKRRSSRLSAASDLLPPSVPSPMAPQSSNISGTFAVTSSILVFTLLAVFVAVSSPYFIQDHPKDPGNEATLKWIEKNKADKAAWDAKNPGLMERNYNFGGGRGAPLTREYVEMGKCGVGRRTSSSSHPNASVLTFADGPCKGIHGVLENDTYGEVYTFPE